MLDYRKRLVARNGILGCRKSALFLAWTRVVTGEVVPSVQNFGSMNRGPPIASRLMGSALRRSGRSRVENADTLSFKQVS